MVDSLDNCLIPNLYSILLASFLSYGIKVIASSFKISKERSLSFRISISSQICYHWSSIILVVGLLHCGWSTLHQEADRSANIHHDQGNSPLSS